MGTMADSGSHRNYRKSTRWCANLFFCFFSSSMKITRSIFSPARHKDHPFSLSSSLTRRLTSNGSLKGAQSPFPTNVSSKKRRGAALDNPEPSSPKVTCIGQVRVKSKKKKHARKLRTPSHRRSGGGADESFRRMDNWGSADLNSKQTSFTGNRHRNQRWVHLPLTICEGLKCLGASSCFSSSREKSIRRDLEEEGIVIGRERFEANLADAAIDHVEEEESEEEEAERRTSISVPPKNALLLMRSRSDPMRVAALSRRLLESPLPNSNADDLNLEDEKETHDDLITPVDVGGGEINVEGGNEPSEEGAVMKDEENTEHFEEDDSVMDEEEIEEDSEMGSTMEEEEEKEISADSLSASENEDEEKLIEEDEEMLIEEEEREPVLVRSDSDSESDEDLEKESTKEMETVKVKATSERVVGSEAERESHTSDLDRENDTTAAAIIEESGDGAISVLPDCLLLMMREPKVSMEVSKETWVCSTDFKRILPERRRPAANKTLPDAEDPKNKRVDSSLNLARPPKPALKQRQQPQPARSSCSLPGPISAVQKLPRCKSEPRTAAAKLMPSETCMWKSRKVEQLRQSTVGVGPTAGVGF